MNPLLGLLAMSLFSCLFPSRAPKEEDAAVVALPAGRALLVFDEPNGALRVVDPASGELWRWKPEEAPLERVASAQPVGFGRSLLARSGLRAALGLNPEALDPALSPDGARVAFTQLIPATGAQPLRLRELNTGEERELAPQGQLAAWSPDGAQLAFVAGDAGEGRALFTVAAAGGAPATRATTPGRDIDSLCWTAAGDALLFTARAFRWEAGATEAALYRLDLATGQQSTLYAPPPGARVADPASSAQGQLALRAWDARASADLVAPASLRLLQGEALRPLTQGEARAQSLVASRSGYAGVARFAWSPAGDQLAFAAAMEGDCQSSGSAELQCRYDVYVVNTQDPTAAPRRLSSLHLSRPPRLAWLP